MEILALLHQVHIFYKICSVVSSFSMIVTEVTKYYHDKTQFAILSLYFKIHKCQNTYSWTLISFSKTMEMSKWLKVPNSYLFNEKILRYLVFFEFKVTRFMIWMFLHYNWPGFNISSWLSTQGVPYTEPLDSHIVDNLMSDLSMAQFLLEPSCSWTSALYSGVAAKWTNCMNPVIYTNLSFFFKH